MGCQGMVERVADSLLTHLRGSQLEEFSVNCAGDTNMPRERKHRGRALTLVPFPRSPEGIPSWSNNGQRPHWRLLPMAICVEARCCCWNCCNLSSFCKRRVFVSSLRVRAVCTKVAPGVTRNTTLRIDQCLEMAVSTR